MFSKNIKQIRRRVKWAAMGAAVGAGMGAVFNARFAGIGGAFGGTAGAVLAQFSFSAEERFAATRAKMQARGRGEDEVVEIAE